MVLFCFRNSREEEKMKRRISLLLAVIMLFIAAASIDTFAASKTKKAIGYGCIKSGNYVYVVTCEKIFKYNINKNTVKELVNEPNWSLDYLQKKGDYLYYGKFKLNDEFRLTRVNVKTGKKKVLEKHVSFKPFGSWFTGYVINKSKIYYSQLKDKKITKKVMKLNGTSKKKSEYKALFKYKNSNTGEYELLIVTYPEEDKSEMYLLTPDDRVYLETIYQG